MDHAFVLGERIILWRRSALGVEALNRGVQTAKAVATIGERRLRDQQNDKDDENY